MTGFKRLFNKYRDFSKARPYFCAFLTCFVKGSASDFVAQRVVEGREKVSWQRNVAFATYSGKICVFFFFYESKSVETYHWIHFSLCPVIPR